jgi:hypothetical protein
VAGLLAELRAALPAAAHTALNVMLYRGDVPARRGRPPRRGAVRPAPPIVASALPGGTVATTTLRGGYDGLPAAHQAVRDWCAARVTGSRARAGRSTATGTTTRRASRPISPALLA